MPSDKMNIIVEERAIHIVAAGAQGPAGPQGPIGPAGGSALTVTAGVALGGHRIVVLDASEQAIYADNTIPAHASKVLGITLGAANIGDEVNVLRGGDVIEPSWNWTLDQPVFLSTNGLLTQTPPATGFSLIVGFPVTATKLFVSIREPISLS